YKSDSITEEGIASVVDYYRPQLIQYAAYWHQLTGQVVKECGLYLTRLDQYVVV
ncbi:MAG: hypothetical protein IT423_03975, partial [Pirellulaceae bacterium]|nr:hypothetical protein [Pirellulaceae bacterium]